MKNTKKQKGCPADLVFAPTLAFARFSEDLLLRYAMITASSCSAAYVDPFARTWHGFSTTDPNSSYILYGFRRIGKRKFVRPQPLKCFCNFKNLAFESSMVYYMCIVYRFFMVLRF